MSGIHDLAQQGGLIGAFLVGLLLTVPWVLFLFKLYNQSMKDRMRERDEMLQVNQMAMREMREAMDAQTAALWGPRPRRRTGVG